MHQNVIPLHAANRMRDDDADVAQNLLDSLVCIAPLRVGILLTLARLLRRHVKLITTGVSANAAIASVAMPMEIGQPLPLGGALLVSHAVVMMVTTQGPPKQDDTRVRQRHDGVLQRLLFFFPRSCSRCFASACER